MSNDGDSTANEPAAERGRDDMSIPDDPSGEAGEQLAENDEYLREGDEPTPEETVPEDLVKDEGE